MLRYITAHWTWIEGAADGFVLVNKMNNAPDHSMPDHLYNGQSSSLASRFSYVTPNNSQRTPNRDLYYPENNSNGIQQLQHHQFTQHHPSYVNYPQFNQPNHHHTPVQIFHNSQGDDIEQISANVFHSPNQFPTSASSSMSIWVDNESRSYYPNIHSPQRPHSIQSYQSVNRHNRQSVVTPTQPKNYIMRNEIHPNFNSNSAYDLSSIPTGPNIRQVQPPPHPPLSSQQPQPMVPALKKSVIAFDRKTHNRWVIVENKSFDYVSEVQERTKNDANTEYVKLLKNGENYLLFILRIDPSIALNYHIYNKRYTTCQDIYVKEPSKVYINAIFKNKSKNKLKFKPEDVSKLFKVFGDVDVSTEEDCYVLNVNEAGLSGIKNKYDSIVKSGRLFLEIPLETELMTLIPIDESSSSDEEFEQVIHPIRTQQTTSSHILHHPNKQRRVRSPKKSFSRNSDASKDIHVISSDEEDASSSKSPSKMRRIEDVLSKKPSQISNEELIEAIKDNDEEDIMLDQRYQKVPNKEEDEEEDDDEIVMSHSPILSSSQYVRQDLEPISKVEDNHHHILSDNENENENDVAIDEKENTSDVEYMHETPTSKSPTQGAPESQVIDTDEEQDDEEVDNDDDDSYTEDELIEEDHRPRTRKNNNDVVEIRDHEEYIDLQDSDDDDGNDHEGVYEEFSKDHDFKIADVTSKFLILRMIPNSELFLSRFIDDVLLRLATLKVNVVDIHVNSVHREALIEFQRKIGLIKALKHLHGYRYSGDILTAVISDEGYAKKLYVLILTF